ncbi:YciI family protein [Bacillus spongiae]|uniref:YciI family protein n=1 Tax=Bacillus spongiae TaxID=2683610 RepID=A0ABU8HAZ8_9BACI
MQESAQFIYVLKLIPRLLKEENWKQEEHEIIKEHFLALQKMKEKGRLILAGRTLQMDETTFGIVIFEAMNMEEAVDVMEEDPAVHKGMMTAEVYPYKVALMRDK